MSVGRNDPCPCGSGRKYKQCCLAKDETLASERRVLRRAADSLLPKLVDATRALPDQVAPAFTRFWENKYPLTQLSTLDEIEDRGSERFLTWFVFDYVLDDGTTLLQRVIADPTLIEATTEEQQVALSWQHVRLRAWGVDETRRGEGVTVSDLLTSTSVPIADTVAASRLMVGEVVIAHLLPVGDQQIFAGAAAHLTDDTREKIIEFAALHLEAMRIDNPDASYDDLIATRSEVLNHFVMALPVEAPDPTIYEKIMMQTRIALALAGVPIGGGPSKDDDQPDA